MLYSCFNCPFREHLRKTSYLQVFLLNFDHTPYTTIQQVFFFFLFLFYKFKPISLKLSILTTNIYCGYWFSVCFITNFNIMIPNSCIYSTDSLWKKPHFYLLSHSGSPHFFHSESTFVLCRLAENEITNNRILWSKILDILD